MEVSCTQCKTQLNIPDEKIPKDQTVRISCPKCKNKIVIAPQKENIDESSPDPNDSFDETGKMHLKFIESQRNEDGDKSASTYDDYSGDDALDFFGEELKLALVMVSDDMGGKIKSAIEELNYKYVMSPSTRDALGKLRFHNFDMIILADGFEGQEVESSPVRNYLNHLSMLSRRRIFLILMSDRFKTMDDMMAYSLSANLLINNKDSDKLSEIIKRGISEYQKFYKVFSDTLVEVGKA